MALLHLASSTSKILTFSCKFMNFEDKFIDIIIITLFSRLNSFVDGCVLHEVRTKLSTMFTPSVRPHMTGELNSRQEAERFHTSAGGIFGGRHSEISFMMINTTLSIEEILALIDIHLTNCSLVFTSSLVCFL